MVVTGLPTHASEETRALTVALWGITCPDAARWGHRRTREKPVGGKDRIIAGTLRRADVEGHAPKESTANRVCPVASPSEPSDPARIAVTTKGDRHGEAYDYCLGHVPDPRRR